ncbi:TPA: hypothetical protein N0F65_002117 [Lagenidium giganteum]|uniref:Uncharacterized protein n=1 Tax=Lagenidium giganteum TaxID=4803 RepID=A0AAV2ZKM7_9STRA|nr:TPA: hypothetical protein N0F65_002117 [Lagenidium giganteum]
MRTECEADAKLCGMDFGHAILEQANQLFHLSVEGHVCKARLDALEVFENFVGMVKSVPGLLRGIFVLANIEQNVNWPSALDAAVVSHGHGEHVRGQYELEVLMQVGDIDIELDPDRLSSNFRDHLSCKVRRLQQAWSEVVRGVIEKFHERIRQTWLDEEYRKLDKEYQFVRQLIVQKAWERLMGTLQQGKQSSVCVSISVEAEGIFCVFQDAMVTPTDVVDL